jgi:type IV pilus assembly protein PilV
MNGVVLIEVMVAMLIFMFGVLGMVGLQASVTRAQTDSKVRADAAYLASDMVGRLWSDRTHLGSYDSSVCSSTQFCKDWQSKVTSSLPNGASVVTVNAASGNVTISISWTGPDGQTHQYVTNTTIV